MERGLFYLPCGNRQDDMPPSFKGWHDPKHRWNGWCMPLFNRETWDEICAYYTDPDTNTQEDIDEIKEYTVEETARSRRGVSGEGTLYDFGSGILCWGNEEEE